MRSVQSVGSWIVVRDVLEKIDEMIIMILTKSIEYDPSKLIEAEINLGLVKRDIETIEQCMWLYFA